MKKTPLIKRALNMLLFCLLISMPYVGYCQLPPSQPNDSSSPWHCRIIGQRDFDSYADTAYDVTAYDLNDQIPRNFLFADYTYDSISLLFQYNGAYYHPSIPDVAHNIKVYKDYNFSTPVDSFINQPDSIPLRVSFSKRGVYYLRFYEHSNGVLDLWAVLVILPKIQKLWLEAPEICSTSYPADSPYRFKLHTEPPIDSIMVHADDSAFTGRRQDNFVIEPEKMQLDFQFQGDLYSPYCAQPYIYDQAGLMGLGDDLKVIGSPWYYAQDRENFYLDYSSISCLAANPWYHSDIMVTYNDGIQSIPYHIPLVIKSGTIYPDPVDNIPDPGFHFYKDTIFTPTVWTPMDNDATNKLHLYRTDTLRIEDSLYIMPGASLTIHGMTVEFGPNAVCYVDKGSPTAGKNGAYLELDSTTFSWYHTCSVENDGHGDMWAGVVLSGNSNLAQSSGYQAKMVTNYSRIEHAQIGVMVGDLGLYDIANTGTGAILKANGSAFANNLMGVLLLPFHNINPSTHSEGPNQTVFNDCDFTVDEPLPGTFSSFINATTVKGLQVNGCRFSNSVDRTGYGIYGTDVGLWMDNHVPWPSLIPVVKKSSFTGLKTGVYLKTVSGTTSMDLLNTYFYENIQGAQMDGVPMADATKDTFKIHAYPLNLANLYLALLSSGYVQNTGSGYTVRDNRFERSNAFTQGYGFASAFLSTGSSPNLANNNTYIYMNAGNLSNYKNRGVDITGKPIGLQFLCNSHSGNTYDEYAGGNDTLHQGIRAFQGDPAMAAGNSFSTGDTNIYNITGQVGAITYYYHGTSPSYLGTVNRVLAPDNACTEPTNPYGNAPFGVAVRGLNTAGHLAAPHLSDSTLNQPATSGHIDRAQVYSNINYLMTDSAGLEKHDSLYYWVAQAQTAYTDLLYADLILEDSSDTAGLLAGIHYVYDSIAHWYGLDSAERNEFKQGRKLELLKVTLKLSGRSLGQVTETEQGILQGVADSSSMWAKVRAQSWMALVSGTDYDYAVLLPLDSADTTYGKPGRPDDRLVGNVNNPVQQGNRVYPNPAQDLLYVQYAGGEALLRLCDVSGRLLLQKQLHGGSTNSISLKGLQPGMYFYKVSEGGVVRLQGKLAKDQ